MGFLEYLGLDDLANSVSDLTTEIDGIREDIITSVVGPAEELKNTVGDITQSIQGEISSSVDSLSNKN
jgi:hypothetical protein